MSLINSIKFKYGVLLLMAVVLCGTFYLYNYLAKEKENTEIEYCLKVYDEIKDFDIYRGYVENNKIIYYENYDKEKINEIDFKSNNKKIKFYSRDENIFFILFSMPVDNERGYVIFKDNKVSGEGIKKIGETDYSLSYGVYEYVDY